MNEGESDVRNREAKHTSCKRSRRRAQGVSKVKTGCTTCKIRRVKCDENRPSCTRCISSGRKCDGYGISEVVKLSADGSSAAGGIAVLAPTFAFEGSYQERRAFDLFRTKITFQLSGDFDGWFWNTLLLQATHQEPAIRHAVLALSSLCEQYDTKENISSKTPPYVTKEGPLALQQYNWAIAELTSAASKLGLAVDVCLMTCMLFAYFEVIRGHHGSAMSHISSGVKILSELQPNAQWVEPASSLKISAIPYVDLQSFEVIFNRLNSQASQIAGLPAMQFNSTDTEARAAGFSRDIPSAFKSVEEARNSLEYHSTQCVRRSVPATHNPTANQLSMPRIYIDIFEAWQQALEAFLKNAGRSLSIAGKQLARVMLLNKMFLSVNVIVSTSENPLHVMHWDNYLEDFTQMIILAREIVEQGEADLPKDPRNQHRFSIGMNCIAPLYGVASSCRDPVLRREAVALLQRSHNQQGLWDANVAARICGKLIEIEERGSGQEVRCCADVPVSARMSGMKVIFDSEGSIGAIAYRKKPGGFGAWARNFEDLFSLVPDTVDTGNRFTESADLNWNILEIGEILREGE